jgi:hypothetical protein
MDANKLIRIINKDLEELKTLTSDIAEAENDSYLMIDLAVSRARLLCQEIELLKEITVKPIVQVDETAEDSSDSEEEPEVSDTSISEPELEIINYEVQESLETEEFDQENEEIVYNSDEDETDEEILEDETEEDVNEIEDEEGDDVVVDSEEDENDDLENPAPVEDVELEVEDKRNTEEDETDKDFNNDFQDDYLEDEEDETDDEEEFDEPEDLPQNEASVEVNELDTVQHSEIREIQIEDLDEEEPGTIQFTPVTPPADRPIMREIPKPEITIEEKPIESETFHKDRSLNDVISENKSAETTLGNSPISSLKSSIGLNDRFLFIREIFSNNTDKYNMVIDHLDKLETIQQAVDYLKANLTLQKNETSMKFVDLLKRRFTK